ncbi:MAG: Zn-dependent exopeptidase M28 [candidate division Zixibacteria bacterium]|nr:Zn-dependent exopeptidase M28 [candidate division Zixibacteria bacterium]
MLRVSGGYLVLCAEERYPDLANSGLYHELVASDIDRTKLLLDMRVDSANVGRYPLVFEQGNLRLFQVEISEVDKSLKWPGLAPLQTHNLKFLYKEPPTLEARTTKNLVDLSGLISQIDTDSCQSYMEQLEAFDGRLMGTSSNYASRDWIVSKLHDFGYDSVVTDTFWATNFWESPPVHALCNNVIAYKVGTEYPLHQIIVCAHRDSYPLSSPGADDDGSGTTAVLEIARILKDIDTRQTFVFCLLDAEETGIWGAWNYANRAFKNQDSITLVLNLDCISYEGNFDTCMLYGNDEAFAYSQLWQDLADSLSIGIHGILINDRAEWDGVAFDQLGYNTISLGEQIYTWGIHSNHDSTVYCDFDYLARITKASLAMVYTASETYVPDPMLLIDFPNDVPSLILPGSSTNLDVNITGYAGGQISPGSGQLHYIVDDESYASVVMTHLSGDSYQATFPPFPNLSRVQFYLTGQESGGATIYAGSQTSPFYACAAVDETVIFHDNFESNLGWYKSSTSSSGNWARTKGGGYGYYGQAPTDYDQSGYCYFTGPEQSSWAHSDIDDGTTSLRSPVLDATEGVTLVEYARWYSNNTGNNPYADIFEVKISNDNGYNFAHVATIGPVEYSSGGWFIHKYWVSDYVTPSDQIRLQFEASDLGDDSEVEAAIDAVRLFRYSSGPDVLIETESLPDWTANHPYGQQLNYSGGYGVVSWTDQNNDLESTGLSLSSVGLLSGVPVSDGLISFTAKATDGIGRTDTITLSLQINPQLLIDTTNLISPQIGKEYSAQLMTVGGTGVQTWTDRDDDLPGTGLALSSDGNLHGIPLDTGFVSFVAQVEDEIGAIDNKIYDLHVYPQFICGDVDGDTDGPNIADLTYLVAYLFNGGPPPLVLVAGNIDGITGPGGKIDISDLTSLVAYLFTGGSEPVCE